MDGIFVYQNTFFVCVRQKSTTNKPRKKAAAEETRRFFLWQCSLRVKTLRDEKEHLQQPSTWREGRGRNGISRAHPRRLVVPTSPVPLPFPFPLVFTINVVPFGRRSFVGSQFVGTPVRGWGHVPVCMPRGLRGGRRGGMLETLFDRALGPLRDLRWR